MDAFARKAAADQLMSFSDAVLAVRAEEDNELKTKSLPGYLCHDEHHFKESLKSYFTDKNLRLLKLSEVDRIPF